MGGRGRYRQQLQNNGGDVMDAMVAWSVVASSTDVDVGRVGEAAEVAGCKTDAETGGGGNSTPETYCRRRARRARPPPLSTSRKGRRLRVLPMPSVLGWPTQSMAGSRAPRFASPGSTAYGRRPVGGHPVASRPTLPQTRRCFGPHCLRCRPSRSGCLIPHYPPAPTRSKGSGRGSPLTVTPGGLFSFCILSQ